MSSNILIKKVIEGVIKLLVFRIINMFTHKARMECVVGIGLPPVYIIPGNYTYSILYEKNKVRVNTLFCMNCFFRD